MTVPLESDSEQLEPGCQTDAQPILLDLTSTHTSNASSSLDQNSMLTQEVYRRICKIEKLMSESKIYPDQERLQQSSRSSAFTADSITSLSGSFEIRSLNRHCDTPINQFLAQGEDPKLLVRNEGRVAIYSNARADLEVIEEVQESEVLHRNRAKAHGKLTVKCPVRSSSLEDLPQGFHRKLQIRPTPRLLRKYFFAGSPNLSSTPLTESGASSINEEAPNAFPNMVISQICAQLPELVNQACMDFENMEFLTLDDVKNMRKEREILLLRAAELECKMDSQRKYRESLKHQLKAEPRTPGILESLLKAYRKETHVLNDLSSVLKRLSKCTAHLLEHNTAVLSTQLAKCENEKIATEYAQGKVIQKIKDLKAMFIAGLVTEKTQADQEELWTKEREELYAAKQRLREKCAMLSDEVERLKHTLNDIQKSSSKKLVQMRQEIVDSKAESDAYKQKVISLENELEDTSETQSIENVEDSITHNEAETQTKEVNICKEAEKEEELKMLRHELQLAEHYQSELIETILKRDSAVKSLEDKLKQQSEHRATSYVDANDLQLKLQACRETLEFQEAELNRSEKHLNYLKIYEQAIGKIKNILNIQTEEAGRNGQVDVVISAIAANKAKTAFDALDPEAVNIEFELRDQIDQLNNALRQHEQREQQLEVEHSHILTDFEHLTAEWTDFQDQRKDYDQKIKQYQKHLLDLQRQLVEREYELQLLKEKPSEESEKQLNEFSSKLNELKSHYDKAIEDEVRLRLDAEAKVRYSVLEFAIPPLQFRLLAEEISTGRTNPISQYSQA